MNTVDRLPPELGMELASMPRRMLATVIDMVSLVGGPALFLWHAIPALLAEIHRTPPEHCGIDACANEALSVIIGLPMWAIILAAAAFLISQYRGATMGMRIAGIAIVRANGERAGHAGLDRAVFSLLPPVSLPTAVLAVFAALNVSSDIASWLLFSKSAMLTYALWLVLPYLWVVCQPEHRSLPDVMAGTWVVRRRVVSASSTM